MKYRLGDICTIAKGATGIMKAVPGPYPMVTLAEDRKQHDEYQFDAAAVIVPLISSTGHGHASIKRIHYQEGKFALGTILCAVIPKDEAVLNPRYLFVYLQQFKDSVLVPLMKGAANVSLPLNKLASLEIEVPTLAKQQEVIDLAHVLTGHKNDLEALLDAQENDTVKLRQALLREAMQGQLLPQDPTDEPAALLLKNLQAAKAAAGKGGKGKAGALFAEEAEGPFEIPESWVWCKLGDVSANVEYGTSEKASLDSKGVPVLRMNNIQNGQVLIENLKYLPQGIADLPKLFLKTNDLLFNRTNSAELVGKAGIYKGENDKMTFASYLIRVQFSLSVTAYFANYFINSLLCRATEIEPFVIQQNGQANFNGTKLKDIRIPLPPLAEQRRIVAKLEQLMQHCDALEQRIRESRRLAEQLLQTALREALAPPAGAAKYPAQDEPAHIPSEPSVSAPSRRGRPRRPSLSLDNPPPDLFSGLFPAE